MEIKYDSILNLNKELTNTTFYKFYNILNKEKNTAIDSLLIEDYKNLQGKDSLIDLYIWDRIHSINQNITKLNVYKEFKGTYILKPNHNKKYAKVTKIKIGNDSCYIYYRSDLNFFNFSFFEFFECYNKESQIVESFPAIYCCIKAV